LSNQLNEVPAISQLTDLISSLTGLENVLPESGPINLFSLNNQAFYTNKPNIENQQSESGSFTFNNWWIAEGNWDLIFNFDWNISDIIDPLTDLTRFLAVNPVFEAYGTIDGSFTFHFDENWWVKVSGYVDPARSEVLSASLWYPVANYPTWWAPRDPKPRRKGVCFGAKSHNFPVHS
jgi:hypothetical protein